MWAVGGHSSWLGAQTSRVTGPRPSLVPTPPAQGENIDVGRAARLPAASSQITHRYDLEGGGRDVSAGRHRGRGYGTATARAYKAGAAELSTF